MDNSIDVSTKRFVSKLDKGPQRKGMFARKRTPLSGTKNPLIERKVTLKGKY